MMEDEIIIALNGKKVEELNQNLINVMEYLFGALDYREIIKSEVVYNFAKADFSITYQDITKYVSMKTGEAKGVHSEEVDMFCSYLKENGISDKTINTILLFQYGDGTLDGTGKTRFGYNVLMRKLENEIIDANDELNKNKEFVIKTVKRAVLGEYEAINPDKPIVDAVYYGTVQKGYIATRSQIISHIKKRSWDRIYSLHIGPLMIRPHARYVDKKEMTEKEAHARKIVNFTWFNFVNDIKYISSSYSNYVPKPRRLKKEDE